ncbi:MAG: hypothetical protein ACYC67_24505 [Prosthecobacter sp.]
MKLFISAADAIAMSMALYELHRPAAVRDARDGTTSLYGVREALDKSLWLEVDTELSIRIHPQASLDAVAALLQPYVNDGRLPAGTMEALAQRVEALRGGRMVVYDEFPALFKLADAGNPTGLGRTEQMMIDAGLLAVPGGMMK